MIISAYVENYSTRKDNTVKIVLSTQELTKERAGELFGYQNKLITCLLKEGEIQPNEIALVDKIDPLDATGKSQSQRIRNTLAVLYNQEKGGYNDFDSFYKAKTEAYIEHLKKHIK
jgi:hypothetical protein